MLKVVNGFAMQYRNLRMPTWSTASRPDNPKEGELGFNTETDSLEIYDGSGWFKIALTAV